MLKKILTWAAIILVAIWVIHHPTHASDLVHQVTSALTTLANNL